MLLKDHVAIVTGAGQGIGKDIACMFAAEGARVAVCDVREETSLSVMEEIRRAGHESISIKVDVSQESDATSCVNKVLDTWGRVDILVNNAGVTRDGLLMRMNEADWDFVLDINLKGTFNFLKAVSRQMMKQRHGVIVNVASIIGLIGNAGQANYAASKGGVISLTKTAARELASRRIRVNAVAPGFIETAMTQKLSDEARQQMLARIPLGRMGDPSDVARAVLFLASDLSSYISGQVIVVDGGMVM